MPKFDIFLSHANSDTELAKKAFHDLKKAFPKLAIWVDFEMLQPGSDWAEEIVRAASGAGLFLVIATNAAFESRWVQHEIGIGLNRRLFDKVPIIFLAFDPDSIPTDLKRYQYIDFREHQAGLERLIKFVHDQFDVRGKRHRTLDSMPPLERGKIYAFLSCPDILAAIPRAELRRRICGHLSRKQVSVLWYDVLQSRMDDEVPEQPIANCVMELLLRCDASAQIAALLHVVCQDYPHLATSL